MVKAAGWRQMLSPDTVAQNGAPTTMYALDNGAWPAFVHGRDWDPDRFMKIVDLYGERADFVVVPDKVTDRDESLRMAGEWLPRLSGLRCYLALQDGMEWDDVKGLAPRVDGFFLGGSTDWKLATMPYWGRVCADAGLGYHVARVNTARRIRLCFDAGAHSFDGSSVSRFAKKNLRRLDNEVRQSYLFGGT